MKTFRNRLRSGVLGTVCALLCCAVVTAPVLITTGCNGTNSAQVQKTVSTLAQTLGNAAANVAQLEGNPQLATQLTADTAAAVKAITNWQQGSAVDEAIEALGIVQDDLNLFPAVSQYAPLVDIAIGTVQTILSLIPPSAVTSTTQTKMAARAHRNRTVFLGHPAPTTSSDFKKQWNAAIKSHPEMKAATIH